jgi:hypothetical protein
MLQDHVFVGQKKPVSYLPIDTIEKVLGKSISQYQTLISRAGNRSRVFAADSCCIRSGAVYAFSEPDLDALLEQSSNMLLEYSWPRDSQGFIEKIAAVWFDDKHPVLAVIRKAFGEN